MSEHDRQISGWDMRGAAATLRTAPVSHRHPFLGDGYRLVLLEAPSPTSVDLYVDRLIVRYRNPLASLSFLDVAFVEPENDHIRIESADEVSRSLGLVYPDGSLTL